MGHRRDRDYRRITPIEGLNVLEFNGKGHVGAKQRRKMKKSQDAEKLAAPLEQEVEGPKEAYQEPKTMESGSFSICKIIDPEEMLIVRSTTLTTCVNRVNYFPGPPKAYFVRYRGENNSHRHKFFPPTHINLPTKLKDKGPEIIGELTEIDSLIMRYEREFED